MARRATKKPHIFVRPLYAYSRRVAGEADVDSKRVPDVDATL